VLPASPRGALGVRGGKGGNRVFKRRSISFSIPRRGGSPSSVRKSRECTPRPRSRKWDCLRGGLGEEERPLFLKKKKFSGGNLGRLRLQIPHAASSGSSMSLPTRRERKNSVSRRRSKRRSLRKKALKNSGRKGTRVAVVRGTLQNVG